MKSFLKSLLLLVTAIPGGLSVLTAYIGPDVLPLAPWANRIVLGYDKFSAGIWTRVVGREFAVVQGGHSFLTFTLTVFVPAFVFLVWSIRRHGVQPDGNFINEDQFRIVVNLFATQAIFGAFLPSFKVVPPIFFVLLWIAAWIVVAYVDKRGAWAAFRQILNPSGEHGILAALSGFTLFLMWITFVLKITQDVKVLPEGQTLFVILLLLEFAVVVVTCFRRYRLPFYIFGIALGPFLFRWLANDVRPAIEGFLSSIGLPA